MFFQDTCLSPYNINSIPLQVLKMYSGGGKKAEKGNLLIEIGQFFSFLMVLYVSLWSIGVLKLLATFSNIMVKS